jgi:hypothetical protein
MPFKVKFVPILRGEHLALRNLMILERICGGFSIQCAIGCEYNVKTLI